MINVNERVDFTLRYTPGDKEFTPETGRIVITSNDAVQPVFEFKLFSNNIGEYIDYFEANPDVKDLTVGTYDPKAIEQLTRYLSDLEADNPVEVEAPEALKNAETTGVVIANLSDDEHWKILGAKAAHAIWLDKNQFLPWSLADYSASDLAGLLSNKELFYTISGTFYAVADYSPFQVYDYLKEKQLIGNTILETMLKVYEDLRTTDYKLGFIHGTTADPDEIYSLYDALTTYKDRGSAGAVKISRHGCQSSTRIIVGMLRSVNIPGFITTSGMWFERGHSSAYWPFLNLVMPHGDDIYTGTLKSTPVEEMLTPVSIYSDPAYIELCGNNPYLIARRHTALRAMKYPDEWTLSHCCDPGRYDYSDALEYLNEMYNEVLTVGEIESAMNYILENYCSS
ncbi:MAG: hypothetical protein JXR70_13300 [Spirochaetales bacterium]|nr:hypothetical protein [Spirochaetales bacterium]